MQPLRCNEFFYYTAGLCLYSIFIEANYVYLSATKCFFLIGWLHLLLNCYRIAALVARFISASATRCSVRLYAMHDSHDFALDYPHPLVACRPTVRVWRATSFPIFVDVNTTIILNN